MKNKLIKLITLSFITLFSINLFAQEPPPPPPPGHGTGGNVPGGGAPIGSGIAVLLALGAAYGAKKVYEMNERKTVE